MGELSGGKFMSSRVTASACQISRRLRDHFNYDECFADGRPELTGRLVVSVDQRWPGEDEAASMEIFSSYLIYITVLFLLN